MLEMFSSKFLTILKFKKRFILFCKVKTNKNLGCRTQECFFSIARLDRRAALYRAMGFSRQGYQSLSRVRSTVRLGH